jgi:hypothetical protein
MFALIAAAATALLALRVPRAERLTVREVAS